MWFAFFLVAAMHTVLAALHVRARSWGWAMFSGLWVIICTGLAVAYKVAA